MMGKGEERAHGAPEQPDDDRESSSTRTKRIFDEPATLREPAAPRVPRVMPPSAVAIIPMPGQARADAQPTTLQEAREATDALLREIFEEDLEAPAEPGREQPPARATSREEDWPQELHSLPLVETAHE
jgi:hypothetical protein